MLGKLIADIYKKTLFSRHDDDGSCFYLSYTDFSGLKREPYTVVNQKSERLSGFFYYYDDYKSDALVIFEHGMGVGHRAYMREIERIAREGYLVFSYDHTGCTESEGEHIRGFGGSLADLDAVVTTLLEDAKYKNKRISVIGHSWGGFSTMNIGALHKELHALVAISGFISIKDMQKQVIPLILRPFSGSVYRLEEKENPDYFDKNAVESLKETEAKVLIIHSTDDRTVSSKLHFEKLYSELSDKENITFLSVEGKNHNPNYTKSAVKYKDEYFAELTRRRKAKTLSTEEEKRSFNAAYDIYRITEQDETVWTEIFNTIK